MGKCRRGFVARRRGATMLWRWSWLMLVAVGCSTPGMHARPGARACGTIVPLTSAPADAAWTALLAARRRHPDAPMIVIINPANGPGQAADPAFATLVGDLGALGVRTVGYVATHYAQAPISDVVAAIDRFRAFYPALDGCFFDEMSNRDGDQAYYAALSAYCKRRGATLTVGNPGTSAPQSFADSVDILIVYERRGLPAPDALATTRDATRTAMLAYDVPAFDAAFVKRAQKVVGYIYITDGAGADPWRRLSRYFEPLLAALAAARL
jgi:hypothetical protein